MVWQKDLFKHLKLAMKAAKNNSGTVQTRLSKLLIAYRNTPHSTINEYPATLFLGRKLATRLDLVKLNLSESVSRSQQKMVRSTRDRQFDLGDSVAVRDYWADYDKWIPGKVFRKTGPLSYQVEVSPGTYWRRHADQIQNADWSRSAEAYPDIPVGGSDMLILEHVPSVIEQDSSHSDMVATPVKSATPPKERCYPIREPKKQVRLDL